MSIVVNLCVNSSPKEKLSKNITVGNNYECLLKEDTSILRPRIIITTSDNITGCNYMHISDFSRWYFIDDIISLNNNRWEIRAHVDVLSTYENAIRSNTAVIKRQENLYNTYLNDPEWKVYEYDECVAFKFSASPFAKALQFLLVTAG